MNIVLFDVGITILNVVTESGMKLGRVGLPLYTLPFSLVYVYLTI